MAFNVIFTTTNKKRNSTKAVSGGTSIPCNLLSPCSIDNPDIKLHVANPTAWNYCTIPEFSQSYFIEDWEYNDTFWIAHCTIDPLGSYRSDILARSAYALFSDSHGNEKIADNRVTAQYDLDYSLLSASTLFPFSIGAYYVLRTIGENGQISGYILSRSQYNQFLNALSAQLDFTDTAQAQFADALGCIVGCMHFPFMPAGTGASEEIFLGSFGTGVQGVPCKDLSIESATLTWTRPTEDWRDAVFCDYSMLLPFVGSVSISSSDIGDKNEMSVVATVDWIGGGVLYKIFIGNALICTQGGAIGNSVPVTGYMSGAKDAITGAVDSTTSAIGSFASGNVVGGVMGLIGGAASSFMNYKSKTASVIGSTSACTYTGTDATAVKMYAVINKASDNPANLKSVFGLPCMKIVNVGACSGYLQTAGFSCAGNAPAFIKDMINAMMDEGVFIE